VSTREQNPDSQQDKLEAAGIDPGNVVIEKISGKLASRPRLDALLGRLGPGDQVVVTRLRRIGRNHQHLLDLSAWFDGHGVDFIVLEQASTRPPRSADCSSGSWPPWPSSTGRPSSRAPWRAWPRPGPAAAPAAGPRN
jgi:DNA invertase Pin-like site-specific DNA recombinase